MSDQERPKNVLGRTIKLSEGRLVFFGQDQAHPDMSYFAFRNSEGRDLKFSLSREARDALRTLLTDPMSGMPLADFPHRFEWRAVEMVEARDGDKP